ncbi:uncharacterized protein LOC107868795 [Capsicum annuum]|uniref:uncharacterized protein LOC107868795 n=1 Tax=Capsicum annuum TaxID=4072 RepID=UPI0007BF339A|nr:uncharacterized protein LOC107868795 [Capsicum annuum]
MVRGTDEHGYSCLPTFSYMINVLNVGTTYSIMVNKVDCRFTCCFLSLGPCIRGFTHMRKVIVVDDTHLYGKYEGMLLSAVEQNTENHIYPIAFCVIDKENYASWMFFFEKLKSIVIDGPDLCFISDRHKSIANGIVKAYSHAYHGYCMRHLGENLWAYSPEEFSDHFVEFKNYYPEVAFFLEHEVGFEKWSRAYFSRNRFDVMTTNISESVNAILIDEREYPVVSIFNSIAKWFDEIFRKRRAYGLKCKDNKFVSTVEKILRDNMSERDSFYVENISGDERKFDLVKIPCVHAMATLRLKHGEDYSLRVYYYSLPLYKVEEYLLAYSESINVVPLKSE